MNRTGKVISCNNNVCEIEFVRMDACKECGKCKESEGSTTITLPGEYSVGDYVEVSLPNNQFLAAASIAYFVPFLGLIAGLLIGYYLPSAFGFVGNDLTTLVGGAIGLLLCMIIIHFADKNRKSVAKWQPQILYKVDAPSCSSMTLFKVD